MVEKEREREDGGLDRDTEQTKLQLKDAAHGVLLFTMATNTKKIKKLEDVFSAVEEKRSWIKRGSQRR